MIEEQATPWPQVNPLHAFLTRDVFHFAADSAITTHIIAANSHTGRAVVRYAVACMGQAVIGKRYGTGMGGRARRECEQLLRLRAFGLDAPPAAVVRPLAVYEEEDVLIEEYVAGESLDARVNRALRAGVTAELEEPLAAVGVLLATWHRCTCLDGALDSAAPAGLARLIAELREQGVLTRERHERLSRLCSHWEMIGVLNVAPHSLLHGDARPQNFLLDNRGGVTAVDVEMPETGDPAADVGRLVAALRRAGWRQAGEPAVGAWCADRLLASYAGGAVDEALALRIRFYAAHEHLRRARYTWLEGADRHRLLVDAEECLRL